jgi:hypothetical protein
MAVPGESPEGDEQGKHRKKSEGPNRRMRRLGPWVLALLLRVMVDWWHDSH